MLRRYARHHLRVDPRAVTRGRARRGGSPLMPDLMEQLASSLSEPASLPCPAPGVYPGTPMLDYHRWSAASNSRLTTLLRSPARLKAYLDEPDDDTNALIMGRPAH